MVLFILKYFYLFLCHITNTKNKCKKTNNFNLQINFYRKFIFAISDIFMHTFWPNLVNMKLIYSKGEYSENNQLTHK